MALLSKGISEKLICEALSCLLKLQTNKQQDVRLSVLAYVKYHIPPLPMDEEQKEVYEVFLNLIENHSSERTQVVADEESTQAIADKASTQD